MSELIAEYPDRFTAPDGRRFTLLVMGEQRKDGTWGGWLEFVQKGTRQVLRTGQETSQPNRTTLEYWATGIEDVYLEGALNRAREAKG
jgi:hypothetical protein